MNFEVLNKFNIEVINEGGNSFDKIRVESSKLCDLLNFLKNNAQFAFDRLNTIIAIDLGIEDGRFELIYDLHSVKTGQSGRISVLIGRNSPNIPSVVEIFKSAYFDECEIFDLFGINFDKNPNLKRLLMPKGWVGHPLRKDYEQKDERLERSEDAD
ncbi:MAG: NADH-quinone oxidoreductase subunit C [Candidatus Gastranaerophilaceae bacterium]|jgi:NADH-quinone oxidoreductase subunit C